MPNNNHSARLTVAIISIVITVCLAVITVTLGASANTAAEWKASANALDAHLAEHDDEIGKNREALARIDERLRSISESLTRIETKIEKLGAP